MVKTDYIGTKMITASIENMFLNEVDNTALPIIRCWSKQEIFGNESAQYTELDMMEFFPDGTGVWTQFDNTGFSELIKDPFVYRVQDGQIVIRYASLPERYHVYDYRTVNGYLMLIDGSGTPDEDIEIYTSVITF